MIKDISRRIGSIDQMWVYPVKSGRGVLIENAVLTPKGFELDRAYTVVDAALNSDGIHLPISQRLKLMQNVKETRRVPQMARVVPVVKEDKNDVYLARLTWDGNEQDFVEVPRSMETQVIRKVLVGSEVVEAVDQGDSLAEWVADHLGSQVRVVKADGSFDRRALQSYVENPGRVQFQDSYPLHWLMQASVDQLSEIAGKRISIDRFRPNIVVAGGEPQSEHLIFKGQMGEVSFLNARPADRCSVTGVNQETGISERNGPLAYLGKSNIWDNRFGSPQVIFGELAVPLDSGSISVGDPVTVTEYRNPPIRIYRRDRE